MQIAYVIHLAIIYGVPPRTFLFKGNDIRLPVRATAHLCGKVSEGSTWIRLKVRHREPSCMCRISSVMRIHESEFPTQSLAFLYQPTGNPGSEVAGSTTFEISSGKKAVGELIFIFIFWFIENKSFCRDLWVGTWKKIVYISMEKLI